MNLEEKADGNRCLAWSKANRIYHRFLKRRKARMERRRANRNPEYPPAYNRFNGYES